MQLLCSSEKNMRPLSFWFWIADLKRQRMCWFWKKNNQHVWDKHKNSLLCAYTGANKQKTIAGDHRFHRKRAIMSFTSEPQSQKKNWGGRPKTHCLFPPKPGNTNNHINNSGRNPRTRCFFFTSEPLSLKHTNKNIAFLDFSKNYLLCFVAQSRNHNISVMQK